MRLRVSRPGRQPEHVDIDVPAPSRDRNDIALSHTVVDRVIVDRDGVEHREWTGTPEAIEACKRVNPVSAALFEQAHRRGRHNPVTGKMDYEWVRKSDGARLEQVQDDRSPE